VGEEEFSQSGEGDKGEERFLYYISFEFGDLQR
jgi:hypothetical protein